MEKGLGRLIVPVQNEAEAVVANGVDGYGVDSLLQPVERLNSSNEDNPTRFDEGPSARSLDRQATPV